MCIARPSWACTCCSGEVCSGPPAPVTAPRLPAPLLVSRACHHPACQWRSAPRAHPPPPPNPKPPAPQAVRFRHPAHRGVGRAGCRPDGPALRLCGRLCEPLLPGRAHCGVQPLRGPHVPARHLPPERQARPWGGLLCVCVHACVPGACGWDRLQLHRAAGPLPHPAAAPPAPFPPAHCSYGRFHEGRTKLQAMSSAWLDACVKVRGIHRPLTAMQVASAGCLVWLAGCQMRRWLASGFLWVLAAAAAEAEGREAGSSA